MEQIMAQHPIESINGLAKITDDLMWNDDVPLFLTGGLAGLRLGPGAANLAGARQGAERIAWKIDEIMASCSNQNGGNGTKQISSREEERSEFTGGFVNQFEALATKDD
jgi:hypothetical protein